MISFPMPDLPHRVRRAAAWLCFITAMLLCSAVSSDAVASEPSLNELALRLVNESRAERGLEPLRHDIALEAAAQRHAEDMLAAGYFSHTSPDGTTVLDRFRSAGGSDSLMVAENIGNCSRCWPPISAKQIEALHDGWIKSVEHRRNILSADFTRFGFGFAIDRVGGLYAVQTFAGPGAPPAGSGRQTRKILSDAEAAELAVGELNRTRQQLGLPPAQLNASLTRAAHLTLADARTGGGLSLRNLSSEAALERAVGSGDAQWRSISTVAGECGGCGVEPTNSDVEHFMGQWLASREYRDHLLAPGPLAVGFAIAADGDGRKVALALAGSP